MKMNIEIKENDKQICVDLIPELNYISVPKLQKKIQHYVIKHSDYIVIFNFQNVEYMDTSALAMCILFFNNLQENFFLTNIPEKFEYVFALDKRAEKIRRINNS